MSIILVLFIVFIVVVAPSLASIYIGISVRRIDSKMKEWRWGVIFLTITVFLASTTATLLDATMNGVVNGSDTPPLERMMQTFRFTFAVSLYHALLVYFAYRFGPWIRFCRREP